MIVNGVAIEREATSDGVTFTEAWVDAPDDLDIPYVHVFTAIVDIDERTGEYRLRHLRAEVMPVD